MKKQHSYPWINMEYHSGTMYVCPAECVYDTNIPKCMWGLRDRVEIDYKSLTIKSNPISIRYMNNKIWLLYLFSWNYVRLGLETITIHSYCHDDDISICYTSSRSWHWHNDSIQFSFKELWSLELDQSQTQSLWITCSPF